MLEQTREKLAAADKETKADDTNIGQSGNPNQQSTTSVVGRAGVQIYNDTVSCLQPLLAANP